jgi:hypothetical protein
MKKTKLLVKTSVSSMIGLVTGAGPAEMAR